MPIIGMAGHVDHGKSSLVAALTGTHPDRWLEERVRGMTLDLGFADLRFDDGSEAGIVDVPGHERFLHNMLAGAAGMELLVLVVAADDGVMPQTREHLDILRFLNVRRTIVALTKSDVVAPVELEARRAQIAKALADTIARDAPIVPVSSTTGDGVPALRSAIARELQALPPRDEDAPVYFPVDRSFTLDGIGTVVTGTLMQGSIAVGDTLALQPDGRRARVRGVHVFHRPRERVGGGTRVALNLAATERDEVHRGDVLADPAFLPQTSFAVRFTPLPEAVPLLRRRTPVRAYIGSAEIMATLVFETVPALAGEVKATLFLRKPALAFPGVRFVARRASPKTLLGGGAIEGAAISGVDAADGRSASESAVATALASAGLYASEPADIAYTVNLREDVVRAALEALADRDEALRVERPRAYVSAEAAGALLARVTSELETFVRSEPWALGITSLALARRLEFPEPLLVRFLTAFVDDGRLAGRAGYYAPLSHEPALRDEQRALFASLLAPDAEAPLRPVPYESVVTSVKRSEVDGALKALDTLIALGTLVKVADELYRGSQIAQIRARVETLLARQGRMTAAEFRDAIGTSRKYAMPLLEWLDAQGVTIRDGDYRMLRKRG